MEQLTTKDYQRLLLWFSWLEAVNGVDSDDYALRNKLELLASECGFFNHTGKDGEYASLEEMG